MWLRWLFRCSLNSTVLPFEDCSVTNPSLSGEPSPMSNLNLPFLMNLAGSFNSCFMSYCWSPQHLPLPAPPRGMTRCNETTPPTPPGWIRQVTSDLSQSLWLSCEHMISLMLLYWGAQNCTQDSRWGHRNALQGGTITHLDWQAVLFLMLQSCSACHQPQTTDLFALQPVLPCFVCISKITLSWMKNAALSDKFHTAGMYSTF